MIHLKHLASCVILILWSNWLVLNKDKTTWSHNFTELPLTAKMETWFWILGWVLSFLTIIGNGFTIFLVCSRRNLRTKTNTFIVSLAVADFCVGLSVIPSLFFCEITNTCYWPQSWMSWVFFTRLLVSNTSAVNLCGLVLDRFIAIVHSLKYISFMTRRRIFRIIFFSWVLAVSYNILQFLTLIICKTAILIFLWLHLIFFDALY